MQQRDLIKLSLFHLFQFILQTYKIVTRHYTWNFGQCTKIRILFMFMFMFKFKCMKLPIILIFTLTHILTNSIFSKSQSFITIYHSHNIFNLSSITVIIMYDKNTQLFLVYECSWYSKNKIHDYCKHLWFCVHTISQLWQEMFSQPFNFMNYRDCEI